MALVLALPVQYQIDLGYLDLDDITYRAVEKSTGIIREHLKTNLHGFVNIGMELTAVKARLPHGKFGMWLQHEFRLSDRQARRYMELAEFWQTTGSDKTDILSEMNSAQLFALMRLDDDTMTMICDRIRAGESFTAAEITTTGQIDRRHDSAADSRTENQPDVESTIHSHGICRICGRELTNPESVLLGIGAECAGRVVSAFNMPLHQVESAMVGDTAQADRILREYGYDVSEKTLRSLREIRSDLFFVRRIADATSVWALMAALAAIDEKEEALNTMVTFSRIQIEPASVPEDEFITYEPETSPLYAELQEVFIRFGGSVVGSIILDKDMPVEIRRKILKKMGVTW